MRIRKQSLLPEAELNLTPLIDVCFVMLIMFIVIAPLLEMERIELASAPPLDGSSAIAVQEKSPIAIHVYSDDTLAVNKQSVTLHQLKGVLAYVKQKNPTARPQLFHDRNAKFGTYQAVKTAMEAAGFTEMDLILKPETTHEPAGSLGKAHFAKVGMDSHHSEAINRKDALAQQLLKPQ